MGAYAASYSAIPLAVEWINRSLGDRERLRTLALYGPVLVIALGVVNALAQYAQARLSASAALLALRDMQADAHAALLAMDEAQAKALGAGQAVSRLVNDPTALRETLSRALTGVRDLLTLAGVCIVMIRLDATLFAVVIAVYGLLAFPVATIGRRLRKGSREAQHHAGEIATLGAETVANARIIRAFRLEESQGERGRAVFDKRRSLLDGLSRLRALNEPFIFLVGSFALAIIIAVVAWRVRDGALDPEEFTPFIIALLMLSQPARGLSTLNAVAQEGLGAFDRIAEIIDAAPSIVDRPGAAPLHIARGGIAFDHVSFRYSDGDEVLSDFSFEAAPGAMTALVGTSGAGKSTIFSLLLRLHEPQRGAILIDSVRIDQATIASLRNAISIVAQEPMLFDASVAENIAMGRIGASRSEIENAARAAAAFEFITALPKGFDERIGEGGARLSGGQRQRIAIARAFLKDAPILLLDEATAALDAESEAEVHAALTELSRNRTTIVAAHRLSTVKRADKIVALANGLKVEEGSHDSLMRADGYYAKVVRLQMIDDGATRGAAVFRSEGRPASSP
jgi:subfamily B ATP-binding cassette protein MsbA